MKFLPRHVRPVLVAIGIAVLGAAAARADDVQPPEFTNSIGMRLALVPPGTFTMGSPSTEPGRLENELPHEVEISRAFYIGVFPVTQQEWEEVMGTRRRAFFDSGNGGGPDHPMESIDWSEAVSFCRALSERAEEQQAGRRYRLPTEAEWEYACRAGTVTPFAFGDQLSSQQASFDGRLPYGDAEPGPYLRRTTPVGSFEPNAFGLYDMHGNVWEWCADWYDPDYYAHSPRTDPAGPESGVVPTRYGQYYRVVRGGSWLDDARALRSAHRFMAMPENRYPTIGLRVVCEIVEP